MDTGRKLSPLEQSDLEVLRRCVSPELASPKDIEISYSWPVEWGQHICRLLIEANNNDTAHTATHL